jgi:hypothetical protein
LKTNNSGFLRLVSIVFFSVFLLVLSSTAREGWYGDAEEACREARHFFLKPGEGTLPHVPKRSLLMVLSCIPPQLMGAEPDESEGLIEPLMRGLVPAAWGGGIVTLFFILCSGWVQGVGRRRFLIWSLGISLALLFSTPLWMYSRIAYADGLQVLIFIAGMLAIQNNRYFLSGLACAGLLNLRATNVVLILPVLLYVILAGRESRGGESRATESGSRAAIRMMFSNLISVFAGVIPGVLAWCGYNYMRHGSWRITGYESEFFSTSALTGLRGFFLSPGKSIFLYAPVSIAGVLFGLCLWKSSRQGFSFWKDKLRLSLLMAIMCIILPVSMWYGWDGDAAWGPRMVFLLLPVFFIPIVFFSAKSPHFLSVWYSNFFQRMVFFLACTGVLIQLPALAVGARPLSLIGVAFNQSINPATGDQVFGAYVQRVQDFDFSYSPLIWQFKVLPELTRPDGDIDLPGGAGNSGMQRLILDRLTPDFWFWKSGEPFPDPAGVMIAVFLVCCGLFLLKRAIFLLDDQS